jgi:hypothetical protein
MLLSANLPVMEAHDKPGLAFLGKACIYGNKQIIQYSEKLTAQQSHAMI